MEHKNIKQYAITEKEDDDLIYLRVITDYLNEFYGAEKGKSTPLTLDIYHLNLNINPEFMILDNWLDNFHETERLFKSIVNDWSEKQRDVLIHVSSQIRTVSFHKLNHTFVDKLLKFKVIIDSCGNFYSIPLYSKYECKKCGEQAFVKKRMNKQSKYICKCGNKVYHQFKFLYSECKSRLYFSVQEDSDVANTSTSINCYYSIQHTKIPEYLIDASMVGQFVEFVGVIKSISKIINDERVEYFAIEIRGLKISKERLISKERKEEVIQIIKNTKNPFSKLALSMTRETEGQEMMRICMFVSTIGLKKIDIDLGINRNPQFHVLFVGNPATAKTFTAKQLLSYFPRASMIQGRSSTYAGVLGGAEKSKFTETFIIKVGQVKRCDGSFIIMDEMDKMNEDTKKGLFTALSDPSLTSTIVAKLSMRDLNLNLSGSPQYESEA